MKVRFFTLLAVLVIVITGFCVYLAVNKDKFDSNQDNSTTSVTPAPTNAALPTLTPVPADFEKAPGVYPAYQLVDGTKEFGYVTSDGTFKIAPSFDNASDFHDGVAAVHMDNQYLAIDTNGTILYYSENPISDFHNGYAVVSRNSGDETVYGYIDTTGNEVIKPLYKLASSFGTDDTAYVFIGDGKYAQIDKNGKTLKSYEIDAKYKPSSIDDGYITYCTKDMKYGVIDMEGKEIFDSKYIEIKYMGNDIFALKKDVDDLYGMYNEMPYALFNGKGEQIADYTLYDISTFFNGYASVTDSMFTYFIGEDGKEVTTLPKFEGRGKVTLFGDVVKAEIDRDLIYSKTDSTVIWQNDTTQKLSDSISANAVKLKPNKDVLVYYPQIEGLSDDKVQNDINTQLKSIFTKDREGMSEDDQYVVDDSFKASLIKDLLIIERDGYDYPYGAAHGSPIMDFFYIDTKTGTFYQLKDLFIQGSDYIDAINEIIKANIAANPDDSGMYIGDGFTTITETQRFILTSDSLTIYFYPYDIAAYAAGFVQFKIPLEDLYDYIDFNSAFWASFN